MEEFSKDKFTYDYTVKSGTQLPLDIQYEVNSANEDINVVLNNANECPGVVTITLSYEEMTPVTYKVNLIKAKPTITFVKNTGDWTIAENIGVGTKLYTDANYAYNANSFLDMPSLEGMPAIQTSFIAFGLHYLCIR